MFLMLLFIIIILHRYCMNMEYSVSTTVAPTTQEINKPFKRLELFNTTTTIGKYICTNFLLHTVLLYLI